MIVFPSKSYCNGTAEHVVINDMHAVTLGNVVEPVMPPTGKADFCTTKIANPSINQSQNWHNHREVQFSVIRPRRLLLRM